MSYTFFLSGGTADQTQIARVRDEIDDVSSSAAQDGGTEGRDYFLSDERILRRLRDVAGEASNDVNRALLACASALETLSTNQAYVLKKKRTMGEDVDGPAVAATIMAHAKSLKARVALSEEKLAANLSTGAETAPGSRAVPVQGQW